MLIEESRINLENFLAVFGQKFKNFCSKSPVLLSYNINPYAVNIYLNSTYDKDSDKKAILEYPFNYDRPVKENIKEIKDFLMEKYYPILTQTLYEKEIKYSADELNNMVREGKISTDDILDGKLENLKEIKWMIERVIVVRDEIIVRNLQSKKTYLCKLKIPVTFFFKRLYSEEFKNENNQFDSIKAWSFLLDKVISKREISKKITK